MLRYDSNHGDGLLRSRAAQRDCAKMVTAWFYYWADWLLEPSNHATELMKYFRDSLGGIDCSQRQAVPASHVRLMILGVLTMISKTPGPSILSSTRMR